MWTVHKTHRPYFFLSNYTCILVVLYMTSPARLYFRSISAMFLWCCCIAIPPPPKKNNAKDSIAAGRCGCLGSQCGWVNTVALSFGKDPPSEPPLLTRNTKAYIEHGCVKESWSDSLCSELSVTQWNRTMCVCLCVRVLVNATLSGVSCMKKTAVCNDLRNHIKQKEIHLKTIPWVSLRDFSHTRRDR